MDTPEPHHGGDTAVVSPHNLYNHVLGYAIYLPDPNTVLFDGDNLLCFLTLDRARAVAREYADLHHTSQPCIVEVNVGGIIDFQPVVDRSRRRTHYIPAQDPELEARLHQALDTLTKEPNVKP